jgi:hypothetical protein
VDPCGGALGEGKTMNGDVVDAIPKEVAYRLCEEIRAENRRKRVSFGAMQCWGCVTFTAGNPDKMCVANKPGYRGCSLVNARYEQVH